MEPFLIIGIPGLLGGLLLAVLLFRFQHPSTDASDSSRPQLMEPVNAINMARIRVTGIGGLGMVAMASVVAIFVPRIREAMAVALVLGVLFAVALIASRRKRGPLPSSGARPGANTALSIDDPFPAEPRDPHSSSSTQELSAALVR
jgi:hypothetical protein